MTEKKTKIKPVYFHTMLASTLFWVFIPFGYSVIILELISILIYFNYKIKRIDDEPKKEILRRNYKTCKSFFIFGSVAGIFVTLYLSGCLPFLFHYWVFLALIGLILTALIYSILAFINHQGEKDDYLGTFLVRLNIKLLFILIPVVLAIIAIPNMVYARRKSFLSSCSGNLRNLGIIVKNYASEHDGHFPRNLQVLEEMENIRELPTCPISDEKYLYDVDGWDSPDFTISCPNPEKHVGSYGPTSRIELLYYYPGRGVIQVDMDKEEADQLIRQEERKQIIKTSIIIFGIAIIEYLVYFILLMYYRRRKRILEPVEKHEKED